MGVFENNNGVLTPLSTNIMFNNTPSEQFVTEEELQATIDKLHYVTPEMFGADGTPSGNAEAFRLAALTRQKIYLGAKEYYLGNEVIDLKDQPNLYLIGQGRGRTTIRGGTFLLNLNSTWTANRENKDGNKSDVLYLADIGFRNDLTGDPQHLGRDIPQFVTGSLILVYNCRIIRFKKFIAIPNKCYIDRICWYDSDTWVDETDVNSTIIIGCDAPNVYSPWTGSGDDWCFKNCSFSTKSNPLFHVSNGNHCVTFENCINPNVCYSQVNSSEDLPQLTFTYCHLENKCDVCKLVTDDYHTYEYSKILLTFNNCYFHSSVLFNDNAEFIGRNYYNSKKYSYYDSSQFPTRGLTPSDLDMFNGVIVPTGAAAKHKKNMFTKYEIPSIRSILQYEEEWEENKACTTPLEGHAMDYVFYYADNPYTYDSSAKIEISNITPTISDHNRFRWNFHNIKDNGYQNFFIHVFRKDLVTNQVQKCVMYIGYSWLNLQSSWQTNNVIFEDGGDTIGGVYRWLDYDGEFPS